MTEYLVDESGEEIMITGRLVNSSDITPFSLLNDEANLTYGCSGAFPSIATQTQTRVVNNDFSYNTGFTKYILAQNGVMGANIRLDLKMGPTRTWEFYMVNNLF